MTVLSLLHFGVPVLVMSDNKAPLMNIEDLAVCCEMYV